MRYPSLLTPTTIERIELPSGKIVQIPKANPLFKVWTGKPVSDTYGNKLILSFNDKPAFAELAILKNFQDDGWCGVWVDTYRNKYRTEYWPKNEIELPAERQQLLQEIYEKAGSNKGCFDVFCWKEARCIFIESKRQGHDKIRDTQRQWVEAAIKCGLPLTSFLLVEWSVKPTGRKARKTT
jgi:hypothetical protein